MLRATDLLGNPNDSMHYVQFGEQGKRVDSFPRTLRLILYELHLLHPNFHESHHCHFAINYFGGQAQIIALLDSS